MTDTTIRRMPAEEMLDALFPLASYACHASPPYDLPLVLNAALDQTHCKPELILEILFLRQQLIVLKRQVKRPASGATGRYSYCWQASCQHGNRHW